MLELHRLVSTMRAPAAWLACARSFYICWLVSELPRPACNPFGNTCMYRCRHGACLWRAVLNAGQACLQLERSQAFSSLAIA